MLFRSIGMAVDGNVLIYERIREELRAGKTSLAALDSGFRKALELIVRLFAEKSVSNHRPVYVVPETVHRLFAWIHIY